MRPKEYQFKNTKYEKWIASRPCIICGQSPVQKHHVDNYKKNCFLLVPLCTKHHLAGHAASYHTLERESFENYHGLNLDHVIILQLSEYILENHEKET